MKKLSLLAIALLGALSLGADGDGCESGTAPAAAPKADSGVTKASVKVHTQASGLTTEQQNVRDRLIEDNKPGAIKHLYVISAYSGQVVIYSTVKGKITSSGKRLSPTSVMVGGSVSGEWRYRLEGYDYQGKETSEVLQDDGTYGSSVEYVFWWDQRGAYHQHFVSGGQILHISDQPLAVKNIIINIEAVGDSPEVKK